jgi:hypothetical protein
VLKELLHQALPFLDGMRHRLQGEGVAAGIVVP